MTSTKPRILLLADKRDWAYDYAAQSIRAMLSDEFDFQISYVAENPVAEAKAFNCDLVHVFWWGESWHHCLGLPPERVIKEVSSFRWREEDQFGRIDAPTFVERYLKDAGTVVATSLKMQNLLSRSRPVLYTPNGIHPHQFYLESARSGDLKIGWAGNVDDACKGIKDIIMPACDGDYQLIVAPGNIRSRDEMRQFYNMVDVFCVASTAEGQPLPLIESLACGCFPVTVDVGIVPEVIQHRENGLIVGRSVAAFQAAFSWCRSNIDSIRGRASERSAQILASRSWDKLDTSWRTAFRQALTTANGKAPS